MKTFFFIIYLLLVYVFTLYPQVAEITAIEGSASVERMGKIIENNRLEPGTALENGDIIITEKESSVDLKYFTSDEGNQQVAIIKVSPESRFIINKYRDDFGNQNKISLIMGSLKLSVSKLTKNNSFEVDTQDAVMGVRGTEYEVSCFPSGDVLVSVSEGRIYCKEDSNQVLDLLPGQFAQKIDMGSLHKEIGTYDKETWIVTRKHILKRKIKVFFPIIRKRYEKMYAKYQSKKNEFKKLTDYLNEAEQTNNSKANRIQLNRMTGKMGMLLNQLKSTIFAIDYFYERILSLAEFYDEVPPDVASFINRVKSSKSDLIKNKQNFYKLYSIYQNNRAKIFKF